MHLNISQHAACTLTVDFLNVEDLGFALSYDASGIWQRRWNPKPKMKHGVFLFDGTLYIYIYMVTLLQPCICEMGRSWRVTIHIHIHIYYIYVYIYIYTFSFHNMYVYTRVKVDCDRYSQLWQFSVDFKNPSSHRSEGFFGVPSLLN